MPIFSHTYVLVKLKRVVPTHTVPSISSRNSTLFSLRHCAAHSIPSPTLSTPVWLERFEAISVVVNMVVVVKLLAVALPGGLAEA